MPAAAAAAVAVATASIDRRRLAAVFCGGVLGTIGRAGLGDLVAAAPGDWPWATMIVNVAGAFVLGWVARRLPPSDHRRSFLGTGVCGALTTFSTMQVELLQMLDHARWGLALGYALVSLAAGLAAVALATRIAR